MEKRRTPVRTAMTAAVREAWAIFQRRYCRMESPAVFSCTEFCRPPQEIVLPADPDEDRCIRITAFVCDMAEKPPKEKTAAAAIAEYGYVREALTARIPVVISSVPEKNRRTGAGISGLFRITRIKME